MRKTNREIILVSLYQHLLLNTDINELVENNYGDSLENFDEYLLYVVNKAANEKHFYINVVSRFLKNWTFDRLGYLEQAILLLGACELQNKDMPRAIVINEAVGLAKKYCDQEASGFINGVLDQIEYE